MAILGEFNPAGQKALDEWIAARPPNVRAVVEKLPPNRLYRMKSSGHRVTIHSYGECHDGHVQITVNVTGQYNRVLFSRQVFGISPDDLEECDLPEPGEDVGDTSAEAGYSQEDVENILIPELRKNRAKRS